MQSTAWRTAPVGRCSGAFAAPRHAAAAQPQRGSIAVFATVKEFVEDCRSLGATRFIVIGDGAILESVNDFGRAISYNPIPNKGTYATISTEDKSFECHINLHKVKSVKLAKSKPKTGDYDLYATRFFDDSGKMMLSCLLHGKQGAYAPGAVEAWQGLQAKYGEAVDFNGPE